MANKAFCKVTIESRFKGFESRLFLTISFIMDFLTGLDPSSDFYIKEVFQRFPTLSPKSMCHLLL